MKHFKNTEEADKAWKEVVYKMKEAEESQMREATHFEDKLASIIGDKEPRILIRKKKKGANKASA